MAPRTFKKAIVAVSGTFPGYKQADLKTLVEGQGATFSSSVSQDCTHLITTEKDVEKGGVKFKTACGISTCEVVNLAWLLESVEAKKPLPVKSYLFTNDSSSPVPQGNGDATAVKKEEKEVKKEKGGAKKRTHDDAIGANGAANGEDEDESKKMKDSQKASSKKLVVSLDEGCTLGGYSVHIDDSGLIWDATLNQTNAGQNNNKFYRIQLLVSPSSDYRTWTRWGRVGEPGQSAVLGSGGLNQAMKEFEKKFKDKTGLTWENRLNTPKDKKYAFLERNYEDSDDEEDNEDQVVKREEREEREETPVESALPQSIQNLMTFIFNQQHFVSAMEALSYDVKKMPLGKLSKRTLHDGYQILKDLSDLLANPGLANSKYGRAVPAAAEDLSNRYFTTIPHVFGRNRPPVLFHDKLIKKEVELLEALTDMGVTNAIMKDSKDVERERVHQLDLQFNSLGMEEMTPVEPSTAEFIELEQYLNHSRGATHNMSYKVINIFRIERPGETDRFSKSYGAIQNPNRRLLWHGSRSTNFGGILSQGLRIAPPEAPVNGYMFGKGVYFADMSSKSANYCCPYNSGNMGLLMLCDVELGDPMYEQEYANCSAAEDSKKEGKLATLGRGSSIPAGWKDAGSVHESLKGVTMPDVGKGSKNEQKRCSLMYNEYIVYDIAQIRQRYLFHVNMR